MAQSFTTRLFGYDPVERERRKREQADRLTASLLSSDPYKAIGFSIGQLFTAGAEKLFGIEDKDIQRESNIYGAISTASSQFPAGSAEYYRALASSLPQTGEYANARATALEEARKAEIEEAQNLRAEAQFYEKSPEQSGAALLQLSKQLEINPNDPVALRKYNTIAQAASAGSVTETVAQERAATEAYRKNVEFYKKNPEQASARLMELAARIEANPQDTAAINEYTSIAQTASAGAMDEFEKARKEALQITSLETTIERNRQLLKKEGKPEFSPADRYLADRQGAIDFLKVYGFTPTSVIPQNVLVVNPQLARAQQIANRPPPPGVSIPTAPEAAPTPAATAPVDIKARVERAGQVYDPAKYEYRIGPNGEVQRKEKKPR